MQKALLMALALSAVVFSGCTSSDDPESDANPQGTTTELLPAGGEAGSGTAMDHGSGEIVWGDVETGTDGLGFYARQVGTVDNDFAGMDLGLVSILIGPGSIDVGPSPDGDYHYIINLEARHVTPQMAEAELERLSVTHEDVVLQDAIRLTTVVEREDDDNPLPFAVRLGTTSRAHIQALLPPGPLHDLTVDTGSGFIGVAGLRGPALMADTGSGSIDVHDVIFDDVRLDTGSGSIDASGSQALRWTTSSGSGDHDMQGLRVTEYVGDTGSGSQDISGSFQNVALDAGSGSLGLVWTPLGTGTVAVDTGSGSIDLRPQHITEAHGFDVWAAAGSGSVEVDLPNTMEDRSDDNEVHAKTVGFANREVQVTIAATAGSGSIYVGR